MIRLLLAFTFAVCCLVPLAESRVNRIVGGHDTKIEHFPYQVSLILGDKHNCGGSLIDRKWVLTAAHCIKTEFYKVRVGSSYIATGGTIHTVKNQYVHPKSSFGDYDFALLELDEEVTLSDKVQLVKLPDDGEELAVGTALNVTGWGRTGFGPYSEVLQVINVPVVEQATCSKAYGSGIITDRMFCAGYLGVGGRDACQGDSGGPIVANGVQYGVVSFGRGCAKPEFPGVYAKISHQREWIKTVSGV